VRYSLLMDIVKSSKELSEVVAARSFIECTTECNIVEEFTSLCELKGDAHNWILGAIIFFYECILAVLIHIYDVWVRQL
jgi:hypothetical protein